MENIFGERLREIRKRREYTQEELEKLPEKIYGEISEDEGSGYYYNAYREGIQRAIEIVKSGMREKEYGI